MWFWRKNSTISNIFWTKIQEAISILGAKIQTIYVCWTYQVILDNYQKDLISEAMVLWLLFCGLTCNEKWICYKKLFFSYISTFCQKLLFLLLQIVSANYSEMPFNLGQVTRQPQINCSSSSVVTPTKQANISS